MSLAKTVRWRGSAVDAAHGALRVWPH
jgi:hypothetical protein